MDWEPPEHFSDEYDWDIVGADRESRPIAVIPFGVWDVRKAINSGEREEWLRYIDLMFATLSQRMHKNSVASGVEVTQFIMIVDFANFSIKQLASIGSMTRY
jgi:hypothetical protein